MYIGVIDDWSLKSIPFNVSGLVYINDENNDSKYRVSRNIEPQ